MRFGLCIAILVLVIVSGSAQELYTARAYWQETIREPYFTLNKKFVRGDSLTTQEFTYLQEYRVFLDQYYSRLSESEKQRYDTNKSQWDREIEQPVVTRPEEFEWRGRDRVLNTLYGLYYGASAVAIADIDNAAAAGIPLITGGLWLLGPAINSRKYENITQTTVRASHSGKFLGLLYGLAAGFAIAGESDNNGDIALALSTVGSIGMGEAAFQFQKRRNISDGQVEIMRHYGILGPGIALSLVAATESENVNLYGFAALGGGIAGLAIGSKAYRNYNYTRGDVDAISSLTLIATGLGFSTIVEKLDEEDYAPSLLLIPAASAIAATMIGQRGVRGAHFTKQQGSTINLATAGAALIGIGALALAEADSPAAWLAVPSGLALISHQILFHKYKRENLAGGIRSSRERTSPIAFAVDVKPENYFMNKQIRTSSLDNLSGNWVNRPASIVNIRLKF